MDPPFSNGGGGGDGDGDGDGDGVSVRKYTFMNTFLWYFFQTLTLSSMLLMVLSIYYAFASSTNNIQVVCIIISVSFAILSPIFIIPNLPQIAYMAIPILGLNRKFYIRMLNISVWMVGGFVYPFPVHLLCYSLMVGVGLLKMYGDGGSGLLKFMDLISGDAIAPCLFVFNHEIKYGTGRWVDSEAGWALLGLIVVTMLAYFLPPLVEPEKKKIMNEIEAILTEVASEKKMVNVAEAPILGSGTKSLLETM